MAAGWRSGWSGSGSSDVLERLPPMSETTIEIEDRWGLHVVRLRSADDTNRLTRDCVLSLTDAVRRFSLERQPIVFRGNDRFFSAGAELEEIASLDATSAYEFAQMGQALMNVIADFPAPVYAAISGYCMGGGLDLALACRHRIAAPNALFGHRGAALGLITGWGGTQRLPRLIGKGRALEMLVAAEKVTALKALQSGLVDAVDAHPVAEAVRCIRHRLPPGPL
jgi:enoyl-CoA hydratase